MYIKINTVITVVNPGLFQYYFIFPSEKYNIGL